MNCKLVCLCLLLILPLAAVGQEDVTAPVPTPGGDVEGYKEGGEEECEEAWEYVEFLKTNIKEKIEKILQETLFQKKPMLEQTVTDTVEKVLTIRDDILARTKAIRTNDGTVQICEDQNIKQEDFLTQIRMDIMSVLLALIEKDAASSEKLKEIGRQLLAIRTKANAEVIRMIMLRSSSRPRPQHGSCDCGILDDVTSELKEIVDGKPNDEDNEVEDGNDDARAGEADDSGASQDEIITELTMTLMKIDGKIKSLYNDILSEMEEEKRATLSKELFDLKQLSTDLHAVISKIADSEDDPDVLKKIIKRDVRSVRNDAENLLKKCQEKCPTACDSCGAKKITELKEKLEDYQVNFQSDEAEALESIRSDLMNYLSTASSDMTELLKLKAETGALEKCDAEKLDVINKFKGPLWMMVNTTIFGDQRIVEQMIIALSESLDNMVSDYCGAEERRPTNPTEVMCDEDEIEKAGEWIIDIDEIISENLFKAKNADEDTKNAMIGLIDLKSSMDERVKKLFQNNLECKEEVEQIKNIYTDNVMECLAEMMNPRRNFAELDRSSKVSCVKGLRIQIENRRGDLLMREIEKKIRDLDVGYDEQRS